MIQEGRSQSRQNQKQSSNFVPCSPPSFMTSTDTSINLHTLPAFSEIKVIADVTLVPLNESHGVQILDILNRDPDIRARVAIASKLHSLGDIKTEIVSYMNDNGLIRFTLLKKGNPIGMVSFWRDDGFWGEKNLHDYGFGYFLDPKERGKGLITKAIESLIKTASTSIYVRYFVAFCEDDNIQSISVLHNLGFIPTNITLSEPSKGWVERKYIFSSNDTLDPDPGVPPLSLI